jgi:hypothetical protein
LNSKLLRNIFAFLSVEYFSLKKSFCIRSSFLRNIQVLIKLSISEIPFQKYTKNLISVEIFIWNFWNSRCIEEQICTTNKNLTENFPRIINLLVRKYCKSSFYWIFICLFVDWIELFAFGFGEIGVFWILVTFRFYDFWIETFKIWWIILEHVLHFFQFIHLRKAHDISKNIKNLFVAFRSLKIHMSQPLF